MKQKHDILNTMKDPYRHSQKKQNTPLYSTALTDNESTNLAEKLSQNLCQKQFEINRIADQPTPAAQHKDPEINAKATCLSECTPDAYYALWVNQVAKASHSIQRALLAVVSDMINSSKHYSRTRYLAWLQNNLTVDDIAGKFIKTIKRDIKMSIYDHKLVQQLRYEMKREWNTVTKLQLNLRLMNEQKRMIYLAKDQFLIATAKSDSKMDFFLILFSQHFLYQLYMGYIEKSSHYSALHKQVCETLKDYLVREWDREKEGHTIRPSDQESSLKSNNEEDMATTHILESAWEELFGNNGFIDYLNQRLLKLEIHTENESVFLTNNDRARCSQKLIQKVDELNERSTVATFNQGTALIALLSDQTVHDPLPFECAYELEQRLQKSMENRHVFAESYQEDVIQRLESTCVESLKTLRTQVIHHDSLSTRLKIQCHRRSLLEQKRTRVSCHTFLDIFYKLSEFKDKVVIINETDDTIYDGRINPNVNALIHAFSSFANQLDEKMSDDITSTDRTAHALDVLLSDDEAIGNLRFCLQELMPENARSIPLQLIQDLMKFNRDWRLEGMTQCEIYYQNDQLKMMSTYKIYDHESSDTISLSTSIMVKDGTIDTCEAAILDASFHQPASVQLMSLLTLWGHSSSVHSVWLDKWRKGIARYPKNRFIDDVNRSIDTYEAQHSQSSIDQFISLQEIGHSIFLLNQSRNKSDHMLDIILDLIEKEKELVIQQFAAQPLRPMDLEAFNSPDPKIRIAFQDWIGHEVFTVEDMDRLLSYYLNDIKSRKMETVVQQSDTQSDIPLLQDLQRMTEEEFIGLEKDNQRSKTANVGCWTIIEKYGLYSEFDAQLNELYDYVSFEKGACLKNYQMTIQHDIMNMIQVEYKQLIGQLNSLKANERSHLILDAEGPLLWLIIQTNRQLKLSFPECKLKPVGLTKALREKMDMFKTKLEHFVDEHAIGIELFFETLDMIIPANESITFKQGMVLKYAKECHSFADIFKMFNRFKSGNGHVSEILLSEAFEQIDWQPLNYNKWKKCASCSDAIRNWLLEFVRLEIEKRSSISVIMIAYSRNKGMDLNERSHTCNETALEHLVEDLIVQPADHWVEPFMEYVENEKSSQILNRLHILKSLVHTDMACMNILYVHLTGFIGGLQERVSKQDLHTIKSLISEPLIQKIRINGSGKENNKDNIKKWIIELHPNAEKANWLNGFVQVIEDTILYINRDFSWNRLFYNNHIQSNDIIEDSNGTIMTLLSACDAHDTSAQQFLPSIYYGQQRLAKDLVSGHYKAICKIRTDYLQLDQHVSRHYLSQLHHPSSSKQEVFGVRPFNSPLQTPTIYQVLDAKYGVNLLSYERKLKSQKLLKDPTIKSVSSSLVSLGILNKKGIVTEPFYDYMSRSPVFSPPDWLNSQIFQSFDSSHIQSIWHQLKSSMYQENDQKAASKWILKLVNLLMIFHPKLEIMEEVTCRNIVVLKSGEFWFSGNVQYVNDKDPNDIEKENSQSVGQFACQAYSSVRLSEKRLDSIPDRLSPYFQLCLNPMIKNRPTLSELSDILDSNGDSSSPRVIKKESKFTQLNKKSIPGNIK